MQHPILHLRKQLDAPPAAMDVPGIPVRHWAGPEDVPAWLALRERAAAGLTPPPRLWTPDDFAAEMLRKPWWRNERTWLAEPNIAPVPSQNLVGAVTLTMREGAAVLAPVVHWLLVDPAWRRQGIGRLLMSHLEREAWDAGWREVQLETHARWSAAVGFYQSIGFEPQPRPAPR